MQFHQSKGGRFLSLLYDGEKKQAIHYNAKKLPYKNTKENKTKQTNKQTNKKTHTHTHKTKTKQNKITKNKTKNKNQNPFILIVRV